MPALPWKSLAAADPQQQYLVLATRLPLRSYWKIPSFIRLTRAVQGQLAQSEGLVGYALLAHLRKKTFWTVSAWVDREHLDAFVRTQPHGGVMRRLRPHMGPTKFANWQTPGSAIPVPWDEAIGRLEAPST
jgi:heme-degrading monooxygenase HmoA